MDKSIVIYQDYFNADKLVQRSEAKPRPTTTKDLLIDRQPHYCKQQFIQNLGAMFNGGCEELLISKYLFVMQRVPTYKAHDQMRKFVYSVTKFDTSKIKNEAKQ